MGGILKGDVDILGLGNMLQLLSMNRREGSLTLQKGLEKKSIHFSSRGIRLLSSTMRRITRLGKILLRKGRIGPQHLEELLKQQKKLGWKLGQIALTSGLVKKSDLEEALREQIEEDIFDMFMWSDASFEFVEGRSVPKHPENPLAGVNIGANITSLLLEAARRNDEMLMTRRIFHDDEMRLRRFSFEIRADEHGGDVDVIEHILPLIDGSRTLREIVHRSIYPRFITMRAIYALFTRGHLKAEDAQGAPVLIPERTEAVS